MAENEKVRKYTFSKTRSELTDVINRAYYANEKIVISKNGRDMAVIIPVGDFEKLQSLKNIENPQERSDENEILETEVNKGEFAESK